MGRGASFPLALEGALKLKEISYIHAEGYAAGEMKHGPIALIDEAVPIIVIAPHDALFRKDHLQHAGSDGAGRQGAADLRRATASPRRARSGPRSRCPTTDRFITPLLYAIPVQLLAYYAALAKGTDVDQPRNLAKVCDRRISSCAVTPAAL